MFFLRLIKAESYKRGMLLSVIFNIISKGILFLLTIIIARYFGSNIKTDIYFFVFTSMLLFSGFINNIDTAVLIPESMRLRRQLGDAASMGFLNCFLLIYLAIGILFTVGMYFFGTVVFGLISKFSADDILLYHDYFWAGSLFFIFHLLTNYLNTVLTSLKYFSLPMVISSIKSCIVIACIFLLRANYDVLSVFYGGLISYAVNLFVQLYVLKKVAGWNFAIKKGIVKKAVWGNVFYAELGQLTTVISSMLPLYLLSGFSSGIISVMNYGKNIADIPNTLITAQFANVAGIKLNEQVARQDPDGMNDTFLQTAKLLVFILVPVGFFCFVFAAPIVQLFYQSNNFTAASIQESAEFLKLLALTIFSIGINALVTRIFIAMQAIKQGFVYQVILNVLLIAAIGICIKYYGAYGYAYALVIINLVNYIAMYPVCRIVAPQINYAAVLQYTVRILSINLLIAGLLYLLVHYGGWGGVWHMILSFFLYLIVLLALNKIFKLNTGLSYILTYARQKFF